MLTTQLPVLIVCIAACVVIISRWHQVSAGALWGLIGFGVGAFLCVIIPLSQTTIQRLVINSGGTYRAPILTVLPIIWSSLRAATYVVLLVAIFAGRSTPPPQTQRL